MSDFVAGTESMSPELFDLSISDAGLAVLDEVRRFVEDTVEPSSEDFFALRNTADDRWQFAPGQLDILESLKDKAKANGLWNLFLPESEKGAGLRNVDYAYIAAELGKNPLAPEALNCSAPDTGNMEVLERVGTPEQKKRWLEPLLNGEIRSCFGMSEPASSSSDATNIRTAAVLDGDEWVINGDKFFITGAGDPRCKVMICMVETSPDGPAHSRQSQILVPMDTQGLEIVGPMHVFGHDDAPTGHMHLRLDNVRVPRENILLGVGRGFEISQLRLGAGRLHHAMRSVGAAERALTLMVDRALARTAFGRPLVELGGNTELIGRLRIEIEAMRLMVLRAAKALDILEPKDARVWVSAVKAMVPARVCTIIDHAMQLYGAAGLSQWTPLADMYMFQRTLRIADGPDAVHEMVVGRAEVRRGKHRRSDPAVA